MASLAERAALPRLQSDGGAAGRLASHPAVPGPQPRQRREQRTRRALKPHAMCAVLGAISCWTAQTWRMARDAGSWYHSLSVMDHALENPESRHLLHENVTGPRNGTVGKDHSVNDTRNDAVAYKTGKYPVVDAVFTYVNGSDPALQEQMRAFGKRVDPSRVRDFGQLRYAMRSAYSNAPFIRNFIVVVSSKETQTPSWLNVSHPRIRVVEHAEIWDDTSYLPSMNSHAIEWATMNIPGIAPLYLLFNDDMAIQKPLKLASIWPGPNRHVLHEAWPAPTSATQVKDAFGKSLVFVHLLYNKKYGKRKSWKVASHIPILLNTTVMRMIRDDFPTEFRDMYRSKPFRTNRDMQTQFAYQQYVMYRFPHTVVPSKKKHVHFIDGTTGLKYNGLSENGKKLKRVRDEPLQYICIQNSLAKNPTVQVKDQLRGFYEELFPRKAPWEIDTVRPSALWHQMGNTKTDIAKRKRRMNNAAHCIKTRTRHLGKAC